MHRVESSRENLVRMRILNAVDKPLDNMTVNDICHNAGISRQTFYNYFDSKFSIASWWSQCCEQFYLDKIGFEYSWEEGTYRHLRLLFSYYTALHAALAGNDSHAIAPTIARRRDWMLSALSTRGIEIDGLMEYCINVYAEIMTRTASSFLSEARNRNSFTDMTKKMVSIVPAPLYYALQLPEYANRSQIDGINSVGEIARIVFDEPVQDVVSLMIGKR